jgi:hypothetical protein
MPLGASHPDPIHDGEAFITALVKTTLDEWGMYITTEEHDDLILDLLTEALKLEQTFDPQRNRSYAGYASWILRKRVVDLGPRKLLGRNGQRAAERSHDQLDDDHGGGWNSDSHSSRNAAGAFSDTAPSPWDPDELDRLIDETADLAIGPWPDPTASREDRRRTTHTERPGGPGTDRHTPLTRLERERARRQARAASLLGLRATG